MDRERTRLRLDWAATVVVAAVITGFCFVAADATRREWLYIPAARHVVGSIALYTLASAVIGIVVAAVTTAERVATLRLLRDRPRRIVWVRSALYACVAGWASRDTAVWTFSGPRIQTTALGRFGPNLFVLSVIAASFVFAFAMQKAVAAVEAGKKALPITLGVLSFALAAGLAAIDLTVYVALYSRLHTLLELSAALAAFSALLLGAYALAFWSDWALRVIRGISVVAVGWALLMFVVAPVRAWLDSALRHVWLEEVYVGRILRRYQTVEAFLSNPGGWHGLAMSRVERLQHHYDIKDTKEDVKWFGPMKEPVDFAAKIRDLRGERTDFNIVVYYVDTLRADVAYDPATMPALNAYRQRAIDFRQAYSAGSDTLRALPALTGGNYFFGAEHRNDLLAVARRSELTSVLFIAQSAFEFLAKQRPAFKFEQTVRIPDYPPNKQDVWGYGGESPTAARIVDEALSWLRVQGSPKHRFMLWLFNFDQHNWRELDEAYVNEAAAKYGITDELGLIAFRYRVIARAIDAEFERLLHGLDRLGLTERTVVVFVSDHGEALGRDGFWVHSVFLWEPLVRVPLCMRVPGIAPQVIEDKVSLVDVAPTLARYIENDPPTDGYQGEDLLGYLVPGRPRRRLPILMAAVAKEQLVRVGLVDPEAQYKLVLSLEAAVPELYELTADDPDAQSVADREPTRLLRMLNSLVRSPVFPRSPDDFGIEPDDSVAPTE